MIKTASLGLKDELNTQSSDNIIVTPKFIGSSSLISKNITVCGRRTSIRLEAEMWEALKEVSSKGDCKIHDVASYVYLRKKPMATLTAAIRVFLLTYYRDVNHSKIQNLDS